MPTHETPARPRAARALRVLSGAVSACCPGSAACRKVGAQGHPGRPVAGGSWQASGWRVLAAHCCVMLTPGAISLPVAFMRLSVSAITAHLPSMRDAGWLCLDCSLFPGGPAVLLMGQGGRTCTLCTTLPSLEMHTPRVAWAAPARAGSHMCSSGTWKSPFPRAPHGERNACLVSLLCT